jgi:CSLREA domain-containing protein
MYTRLLRHVTPLLVIAGLVAGFVMHGPSAAYAASMSVTTMEDELNLDSDCSLREALFAANNNRAWGGCPAGSGTATDTITLPSGDYVLTLTGNGNPEDEGQFGDLDIKAISSTGAAAGPVVVTGTPFTTIIHGVNDRVFDVLPGANVTIKRLMIRAGSARGLISSTGGGGARNRGKLKVDTTYFVANDASGGGAIKNNAGATLTVVKSTFLENSAVVGGAIYNEGKATVSQSTLHDNAVSGVPSGHGGGIYNSGILKVDNSTIDFNRADGDGGGLENVGTGTATLNNVTMTINVADSNGDGVGNGGGISNTGTITVRNTILGNNTDVGNEAPDCAGTLNSGDYNLITADWGCVVAGTMIHNLGGDPLLGPLDSNGGKTSTRMPFPGSPVLDAGDPTSPGSSGAACLASDQRGVKRPRDGDGNGTARCDIGAVER